jgi:hypothetical protein
MGIVLILSSFDFPILSMINHMVPAILSGNSVLLKDNPRTPLSNQLDFKYYNSWDTFGVGFIRFRLSTKIFCRAKSCKGDLQKA